MLYDKNVFTVGSRIPDDAIFNVDVTVNELVVINNFAIFN